MRANLSKSVSLTQFYSTLRSALCGVLAVSIVACGGGSGGGQGGSGGSDGDFSSGGGTLERRVIDNYTNDVIIDTYADLDAAVANLQSTVTALIASTTDANMIAARNAWVAARVPWERSETALFGPVDFYGFDPAMDSWPVNQTDLVAVLNSGTPLTEATVNNLDNTLKGFHTIEYLLYGANGGAKTAAEFTTRELEYLRAATDGLRSVTSALLAAWVSGINGQPPYAESIVKAGQGSVAYPTERAAIEEMVRGMITICDEVANGKIADPFDTRNPNIVESQFSFNSIIDFSNNIRGVQGALQEAVSEFIVSEDPALSSRLNAAVATAITAVERIPEPFRNAILDSSNDSTIVGAQQAIRQVQTILETEVLPLVLS